MEQPVSNPRRSITTSTCETIYEESQPSKRDIAKQLEGVLNLGEKEGNRIKDVNRDKHKRSVRMSHSHPQPKTDCIRTTQTKKDPASNAHAMALRHAVEPRREKDEDVVHPNPTLPSEKVKDKGMMARGAEKLGKMRKTIQAFNYGKEGPVSAGQESGPAFYALDKKKGSNHAPIIRCDSISSTQPCELLKKATLSGCRR